MDRNVKYGQMHKHTWPSASTSSASMGFWYWPFFNHVHFYVWRLNKSGVVGEERCWESRPQWCTGVNSSSSPQALSPPTSISALGNTSEAHWKTAGKFIFQHGGVMASNLLLVWINELEKKEKSIWRSCKQAHSFISVRIVLAELQERHRERERGWLYGWRGGCMGRWTGR